MFFRSAATDTVPSGSRGHGPDRARAGGSRRSGGRTSPPACAAGTSCTAAVNGSCHCQTTTTQATAATPATIISVPVIRAARRIKPPTASSALTFVGAAGAAVSTVARMVFRIGPRGGRSAARGIRRVAAGRDCGQLGRPCQPAEDEKEGHNRDVADRREFHKVPGRVEAESEAEHERAEQDERARRVPRASSASRAPGARFAHVREPEPDVQRGQQEEEGEGVRRDDEQCDDAEHEHRRRVARELLLGGCRSPRREPRARDEPGRERQHAEQDDAEHRPVSRRPRLRVRAGRRRRPATRRRAPRNRNIRPTQSQKPSRLRHALSAGSTGIRRRRQRANRSTAATTNGTSIATSASSIAQPRTRRWPR